MGHRVATLHNLVYSHKEGNACGEGRISLLAYCCQKLTLEVDEREAGLVSGSGRGGNGQVGPVDGLLQHRQQHSLQPITARLSDTCNRKLSVVSQGSVE